MSVRLIPGVGDYKPPHRSLGDEDIEERRRAVAELGASLRAVVEAAVYTEVPIEELRLRAAEAREIEAALSSRRRSHTEFAVVDDWLGATRMFGPVGGEGNPIAPPMLVQVLDDGRVEARCTLNAVYEGAFTLVHGGVSAMLLDQMFGYAAAASGQAGFTAQLDVTYRAPVPLHVPLLFTAETEPRDGRKVWVTGRIVREDDPETTLVEARSLLVAPNPGQAEQLYRARVEDPEAAEGSRVR